MQRLLTIAIGLTIVFICGGCGQDRVLFVTKTSLGIDYDPSMYNASIAYDRAGVYIAPLYKNDELPPVLAVVKNEGNIFTPKIRQIYATGRAAKNLATDSAPNGANNLAESNSTVSQSGKNKLAFFGTTTTIGLKINFLRNFPAAIVLGIKRKEFSSIPLGEKCKQEQCVKGDEKVEFYPSILASINTSVNIDSNDSSKEANVEIKDFFATGSAAKALSKDGKIRKIFTDERKTALAAYYKAVEKQNKQALMVLSCFASVPEDKLIPIWEDAVRLRLIQSKDTFDRWLKSYKSEATESQKKAQLKENLRRLYAEDIRISVGASHHRAELLAAHGRLVCRYAGNSS